MNFIRTEGRIPTKRVYVDDVGESTDDQILEFAMLMGGETKHSLFGWNVERTQDVVIVSLYTD